MLVLVILLIAATGYLFYLVSQTRAELTQVRDQLLDEISKIHRPPPSPRRPAAAPSIR